MYGFKSLKYAHLFIKRELFASSVIFQIFERFLNDQSCRNQLRLKETSREVCETNVIAEQVTARPNSTIFSEFIFQQAMKQHIGSYEHSRAQSFVDILTP